MVPVLVWLAGCVFCGYVIVHFGMFREMVAFAVCMAAFLWVVGGASWIGRKLQQGAAARTPDGSAVPGGTRIVLTDQDRELLRQAATKQSAAQSS